jgi:PAS domain S-box-containing protein
VASPRPLTESIGDGAARQAQAYRSILRSMPNGAFFLVDRAERIVCAEGPALREFLCADAPPVESLADAPLADVASAADRDALLALVREAFARKPARREVVRAERFYEINAIAIAGDDGETSAAVISCYDVTEAKRMLLALAGEQKRMEAALAERQRAEHRFRTVVESAPDAMVIVAPNGKIVLVNAQAESLFGFTRDEMIGQTLEMLVPERFRDTHTEQRAHYRAHPRVCPMSSRSDLRARRKDGTEITVQIGLSPIETEDGVFVSSTISDITPRKRAEAELLRSNRDLEEFALIASHDLQEPLRKVQMFGDRLRQECAGALEPTGRDYLDRMLNAAARGQTLIRGLLQYSRITRNAQTPAPVDLGAVVAEVVRDLEAAFADIDARVEIGELPTISGDPLHMRQLFQNLIGNALKFRRQGHPPLVRISATRSQSGPDAVWEVAVADNGIGFDERYLDRIFRPFQRLHERSAYDGCGIGLAICRKIVERCSGTITARSTPGEGSTFLVTLPSGYDRREDARS